MSELRADTLVTASRRRDGALARALAVLRRIIGVPDYDVYVAHMRAHHPACDILSRDDFLRERMADKYSRPGSRCC